MVRSIILAALLLMAAPALAEEVPEPTVELLVPGGLEADGAYHVGVAISLPEDWHVYWRYPGGAGIPTALDTSRSLNVAAVDVRYPVPRRLDTLGIETLIYPGGIVLPVVVTPARPGQPVRLAANVSFGFCRQICVPGEASVAAFLDPADPSDEAARAAVAAAEAEVPSPDDTVFTAIERRPPVDGNAVLRIGVTENNDGYAADLFAEGPEGWYLPLPRLVGRADGAFWFDLVLDGIPAGAAAGDLRLTAITGGRAYETIRSLPTEMFQ
jgi:DsbC/DsbD-like thiol-disulfide interchange protein